MVEFGLYTWSDCEKWERKHWLRDFILACAKSMTACLGKEVRFALDMVSDDAEMFTSEVHDPYARTASA